MTGPQFNRADAERRLGPAAIEQARLNVAAAPPLRPELREQLRSLFASAHFAESAPAARAA